MGLTPSRYEVQLVYECPSCELEHYATVEETRFPGGVLCYCGDKIKFKPIQGTSLSLKSKGRKERKPNPQKNKDSKLLEDLVSALCSVGYKKSEAKIRAKESLDVCDNLQDCLNYCFK